MENRSRSLGILSRNYSPEEVKNLYTLTSSRGKREGDSGVNNIAGNGKMGSGERVTIVSSTEIQFEKS